MLADRFNALAVSLEHDEAAPRLVAEFDAVATDLLEEIDPEDVRGRQLLMKVVAERFVGINEYNRAVNWLEMLRTELASNPDKPLDSWVMAILVELYVAHDRLDKAASLTDTILLRSDEYLEPSTEARLRIYRAVYRLQETDHAAAQVDLDTAEGLLKRLGAAPEGVNFIRALQAKASVLAGRYEHARELLRTVDSASPLCEPICDEVTQYLRVADDPLNVPCVHRVLERSFGHISFAPGPHPRVSEPDPASPNLQFRSRISEEARRECEVLETKIKDFPVPVGAQALAEARVDSPPVMRAVIVMHYVKDVAGFQRTWSLFNRERSIQSKLAELDSRFEAIRRERDGPKPIKTQINPAQWVEYVDHLIQQAGVASEGYLLDRFRAFSNYAANFLELRTNDPAVAVLAWTWRCELVGAAYQLGVVNKRECAWHFGWGLENIRASGQLLERAGRDSDAILADAALCLIRHYKLLPSTRNPSTARALLNELIRSAEGQDREKFVNLLFVRAYLADHLGYTGEVLTDVDLAMKHGVSVREPITLEFELGNAMLRRRAAIRLLARSGDVPGLALRLGPFAPFIGEEIYAGQIDREWQSYLPDDVREASQRYGGRTGDLCLGFADGPLLVMREGVAGVLHPSEVMVHEVRHAMRRVMGQHLQTENGKWLQVKRDVPTASAHTFLNYTRTAACHGVASEPSIEFVCALLRWGRRLAESDPQAVSAYVTAALAYFDDMQFVEPDSSYACGAILAGIARGLFQSHEEASEYLSHLTVRDHEEAVIATRLGEGLRL